MLTKLLLCDNIIYGKNNKSKEDAMKHLKKALALTLAAVMLFICAACAPNATTQTTQTNSTTAAQNTTSTTAKPEVPENKTVCYNIIFALATIPPVMAALESIASGYETYAIIERGKTYNGIDGLENFHNAGFDPKNNLSTGFTESEFTAMTEKLQELKGESELSGVVLNTMAGEKEIKLDGLFVYLEGVLRPSVCDLHKCCQLQRPYTAYPALIPAVSAAKEPDRVRR